eukprot:TRINITY_DN9291_c0_g1_i1.p1 TRINITY_DN9291_c0_g1~~TRINITY_DN9291_c0_g1_i1.p1  ORF type:complete len:96 (-),score=16.85 TRINITY_DN9291_c0_g1_i1:138-404(-)
MCNLVMTIVINFIIGLGWTAGNIDNFAHLGGLISGLIVGIIFVKPVGPTLPSKYGIIRGIALILGAGYFIGMTAGTFFITPLIGFSSC